MRKLSLLYFLIFGGFACFAQVDSLKINTLKIDSLHVDSLFVQPIPVIKDANYAGGSIEDLYYYVNNNFNYNNVKKEDVPQQAKRKPYFVFYVRFAVSEDGKTFEFTPKEIAQENSFYKEAVRVIASTQWNIATENGVYKKQYLVIPIKAAVDF